MATAIKAMGHAMRHYCMHVETGQSGPVSGSGCQRSGKTGRCCGGLIMTSLLRMVLCLLPGACSNAVALDFDHQVPLMTSPGGSFYVTSYLAGIEADFLLDTGAGYVTVDSKLFRALRRESTVRQVRRVAARLANGKLKPVTVYEVEHFVIGEGCDVGPVEVAVLEGAGRNLLGLSALTRAAPFAVHTSPPALALSGCGFGPSVATRE